MHYDTYLIPYQRELEEVLIDVLQCRSDSDISAEILNMLKDQITQTRTNLQVMRDALEIAVRLFTEVKILELLLLSRTIRPKKEAWLLIALSA